MHARINPIRYIRPWHWLIATSVLCMLGLWLPHATTQAEPAAQAPLQIATKDVPPFVFVEGEQVTGFSIDLWAEIARRANLTYEWVIVETVTEQIEGVEAATFDAAVGAISMTPERELRIDFSYPFYNSGLQIMVRSNASLSTLDAVASLFSWELLQVILGMLAVIVLIAHIVWLVERTRPESDFPRPYLRGVGEAIWWSAVTVTTVGYGDRTPKGLVGRLIGLIWMFAGLFIIANFTASVTARATLDGIQGTIAEPEDLVGRRVVVLAGTTGEAYARENNLRAMTVATLDAAEARLLNGQADALVYDAPVLIYYAANEGLGSVKVVGVPFNEEPYGIVLPQGNALREEINRALLEMMEDGTYDQIHERWFGEA